MLIIPLLIARPREIDLIAVLAIIGICMNIGLHVVWLGFFRGTLGPNQFGPEPPTAEEQLFSEQSKPRCPISGKGLLEKMSDRAAYRVISPKTLNTLYYLTDQAIAELNKRDLTEKQKTYLLGLVWKRSEEGRTPTTLYADDVVKSRMTPSRWREGPL